MKMNYLSEVVTSVSQGIGLKTAFDTAYLYIQNTPGLAPLTHMTLGYGIATCGRGIRGITKEVWKYAKLPDMKVSGIGFSGVLDSSIVGAIVESSQSVFNPGDLAWTVFGGAVKDRHTFMKKLNLNEIYKEIKEKNITSGLMKVSGTVVSISALLLSGVGVAFGGSMVGLGLGKDTDSSASTFKIAGDGKGLSGITGAVVSSRYSSNNTKLVTSSPNHYNKDYDLTKKIGPEFEWYLPDDEVYVTPTPGDVLAFCRGELYVPRESIKEKQEDIAVKCDDGTYRVKDNVDKLKGYLESKGLNPKKYIRAVDCSFEKEKAGKCWSSFA